MSDLRIWSNGIDYIIASSKEDAVEILLEFCGPMDEDTIEGDGWFVYDDDEEFTLIKEINEPPFARRVKRSASEWCQLEGKCYLACTEW